MPSLRIKAHRDLMVEWECCSAFQSVLQAWQRIANVCPPSFARLVVISACPLEFRLRFDKMNATSRRVSTRTRH